MVATVACGRGARLFRGPVLFVEIRAEVGDVSAITTDLPLLLLPPVLVAQGLEIGFNHAMMVHYLAHLHVPGVSIPLGPEMGRTRGPTPALSSGYA